MSLPLSVRFLEFCPVVPGILLSWAILGVAAADGKRRPGLVATVTGTWWRLSNRKNRDPRSF
jgi:hypothetical protein